ncbi:uncharacterized protein LOC101174619 isoform X1 [Oryzias latipes]|uniref:uncharacterized protein LOC101174619 isoform X1 n=1 Tax=Oryzias latipes TaxID=8090 RepID=UPI0009DAB2EA|nr:uncharacterized protein LOC101174619 isoform X1 [Oryzias latipes]
MKTVIFCLLLLPLAAVVENAPVRAQRNNVVNFLKGTFGSTTEKTTTANPPAYRNLHSSQVEEQDSEEKFKESDEILILEGAANQAVPWRRPAGQNLKLTDTSSRLIEDHDGQKQSGYQGQVQAREEQSDLSSEEEMMLDGKRVRQSTNLQRQPGNTRKNRMSGRPVPDQSQEEPDWDSFENNRGAGAAVDNSRHANCDETRECSSVETHAAIGESSFSSVFCSSTA